MSQFSTQTGTAVVLPLRSSRRKPPELFALGANALHETTPIQHDSTAAGEFVDLRQIACMRVNPCRGAGSTDIGK